jgi:hypothetical protein
LDSAGSTRRTRLLAPQVEEEMDQRIDAAIERGKVQLFIGAVRAVVE